MKQHNRPRFTHDMLRPLIYKVFSRIVLSLTAALLWNEFVNKGQAATRSWAFVFLGAFFAVAAWMSYLRLDGVRAPQFDKTLFDWKRKPKRMVGDMIDYVDEKVVTFEELEQDEQSLVLLIANLVCCAVFFAVSFLV